MFAQLMMPGAVQMGERNLVATRNALRAATIPVAGEAVGGQAGRSVRFFVADGNGGLDTLAFAWPTSRGPMKIYAADTLDFPARTARSIDQWKRQFLYGEFDAELVSDSNAADVIVRTIFQIKRKTEGAFEEPQLSTGWGATS